MATQTAISTVGRNRLEGKVAIITGGDQGIGRDVTASNEKEGFAKAVETFVLEEHREIAERAS